MSCSPWQVVISVSWGMVSVEDEDKLEVDGSRFAGGSGFDWVLGFG